jgi:SnoaL-like domain
MAQLTVDDLLTRAEIADVLQRYVRGIDRVDLDAVERCFHPDGFDDHNQFQGSPAEFVAWLSGRLGRHAATTHFLSEPLVRRIDDDLAQSETYCVAHQVSPLGEDERRTVVAEGLRYLDRFERRGGEWRIAHRKVAVDWRYQFTVGAEGGPPFPDGWRVGRRDQDDPSFSDVEPAPDH